MSEVAVPVSGQESARVDHCERCGGVFLEFFDGDPGDLSRGVLERMLEHSGGDPPRGNPRCPDCEIPMKPSRYLETGPVVSRCGRCMGLFATPSQLREVASYSDTEEPEAETSLLRRLRSFFFSSEEDEES
jgi:Zn-finger nucleic acid-binding protein